jgi:hypothetical protein
MSITGTVSLANIRSSFDNGFAFVDAGGPNLNFPGALFELVSNTTGKKATGYIGGALPALETYGSEYISAWGGYGGAGDYDTFTESGANIMSAIAVDNAVHGCVTAACYRYFTGQVHRLVVNVTLNSGQVPQISLEDEYGIVHLYDFGELPLVNGMNTFDIVPGGDILMGIYIRMRNTAPTNYSATFSLKRVYPPSTTGITIVTAPGGSLRNWVIESGFLVSDAAGYTYTIKGSVRKLIMAAVDARLKTILVTGGYMTNSGQNVYEWLSTDLAVSALPAIAYKDPTDSGGEIVVIAGPVNSLREFSLNVDFTLIASGADVRGQILNMIDDLVRAIGVDPTWGGLAISTDFDTNDTTIEQHEETIGSCTVKMSIIYRTKIWDLKTQ